MPSTGRIEDARFLTGNGCFVEDIVLDDQLYAHIVRSPYSHAKIEKISIAVAREVPGVVGIYTATDLQADGLGVLPCITKFPAITPLVVPPRFALASDRVRHVGDPVALVVAENKNAAVAGAEKVEINYKSLPVAINHEAALREGAPILWSEAPGNIAFRFEKGNRTAVKEIFRTAPHVVELDIVNNRVMAAPIEPRAGIGEYDEQTDTLLLTCTAQGVHAIRKYLAGNVFNLPEDRIQVTAPDVGGGFGMKNFLFPEWVLLLWAARHHKKPIKWVADRGEDHSASLHGRDIRTQAKLALDTKGRFLALKADLIANMGAYLSTAGPNASTNALPTAMGGIYDIPLIYINSTGVFTNTTPIDAYRGAGKPEANFIIERLIDVAARQYDFDAVELRILNAISQFPHETAQGVIIDSGRFKENILDAARYANRENFKERQIDSAKKGMLRGLGFGCFLETARGAPQEGAEIKFNASGKIQLRVGTESNGQGHETTYTQIASERLGLPIDCFEYLQSDTRQIRVGYGHGGARSMHMGGATMALAIDEVLKKARIVAATLLQANAENLDYKKGFFEMKTTARSVSLIEVSQGALSRDIAPELDGIGLDTFTIRENAPFTFPNGCHVAEVEIDPETGAVTLLSYIMVDDYGVALNRTFTEGQLHGGVTQGIGQALFEFVEFDDHSGQLLTGSFMDYAMPRASHLPKFGVNLKSVPTDANVLGVKGVGQAGCIGAPQTVINAIIDALNPVGVKHIQMPATSEAIWRALQNF